MDTGMGRGCLGREIKASVLSIAAAAASQRIGQGCDEQRTEGRGRSAALCTFLSSFILCFLSSEVRPSSSDET